MGDLARSIERLKEKLGTAVSYNTSYFEKVRKAVESHVIEGADDPHFPVRPQRLVADTRKVMGDEDIIALDNGIYKIWYARNYKAHHPNNGAAGQCAGYDGGRLTFGHDGGDASSRSARHGDLW